MGIALWTASGCLAFLLARIVPHIRRGALIELAAALIASLAAGAVATAFDFGGWQTPDWRAGSLAFLLAFGSVGITRLLRRPSRAPL